MAEQKLTLGTKLGFGVGDLGGNLFFTLLSFWALNYLTDVAGLPAAAAGAALMTGKLWDAFVDPLVGLVSDRTRSRWGRRRPYLLFGSIPLALSLVMFFWVPGLTGAALFWWAVVAFALLNTAYSFVIIPYSALTPELTPDYHERTSLNGYRFGFAVIGTILGAAAVQPILGAFPEDPKTGFAAVGVTFAAIVAAVFLVTGFSVRERPESQQGSQPSLLRSWADVWRNKPFRIILGTYTLHLLGITFLSGMLVYYFKYVLHDEGGTTLAMLLLLVVAGLSIPASVWFAKRFGKVRTYQVALTILAVGSLLVAGLGASLGGAFVLAIMAGAGVGLGFAYVPPFAISPDAIEVEAKRTGRREEGAYYGLWNFAVKLAQAGGVAGSGLVLGWAGYVPDAEQTPGALGAIEALIGPVPAVFFAAGALLLILYPLDEKTYKKLVG